MAIKNFRSTVLEPTSEFAYGDKLRFTALSSINQVFKRSFSEVTIGVDGVYDIDLQYGKYRIDYKPYEGIWALFANVEVGTETTATSLQDLAMTSSPVTDDTILALQAILAETKVNAENAEKSSSDSIAAAAEAAKDRDEIEDLMLRAMTTADVEAIREANKNLFAASSVAEWGTKGSTPVNKLKGGLNCTDSPNTLLIDGQYHIAGLIFNVADNSPVRFPRSPDGTVTYNSSTGEITNHTDAATAFAFANADTTGSTEVVTARTDICGIECYPRSITEADPFVYPNGDIHSQADSINGVVTVADDVRPDTYFAMYKGETDVLRGKGVNWFTASNADKLKIISESKKHGYVHYDPESGEWRQWCFRKRSVAGAGNGDWSSIDVTRVVLAYTNLHPVYSNRVGVHGASNDVIAGSVVTFYSQAVASPYNKYPYTGSYTALLNGVSVEVYFLLIATYTNPNSGVWHPSHNPMGCYKYTSANLSPLGQGITSTEQCFLPENIGTQSARPDGRLPHLIYASGHGGVCRDMRYSAYHTTKEESDAQKLNAYSGNYRGFEKIAFTRIFSSTSAAESAGYAVVNADNSSAVVAQMLKNQSVGGDLLHIDVYGNPTNILSNSDLANGWVGGWIHDLPDGTSKDVNLTRKSRSSGAKIITMSGSTSSVAINDNTVTLNKSATDVTIIAYDVLAKQTVPSSRSAIYSLGNVHFSNSEHEYIAESLLGVITHAPLSNTDYSVVTGYKTNSDKLITANHGDVSLDNAYPVAYKSLDYSVVSNNQLNIAFSATELKYDGSWGDDGVSHSVDGESTLVDTNGNVVKCVTHVLAEPIGWVK